MLGEMRLETDCRVGPFKETESHGAELPKRDASEGARDTRALGFSENLGYGRQTSWHVL